MNGLSDRAMANLDVVVCTENLVWGTRCQERFSFFSMSYVFSNSFVRPPAEPFFRPGRSFRAPSAQRAVKDGPVFGGHRVSGAERP
jgi:hypothetical protein